MAFILSTLVYFIPVAGHWIYSSISTSKILLKRNTGTLSGAASLH